MMKRFLSILAITMATALSIQAAPVSEAQARLVADSFFSSQSYRLPSPGGRPALRLAYTAQREHFYVFDRDDCNGFVVVAGDDRLPQVLGYSERGHFAASQLPPSLQYWMHEMDRQITYLLEHDGVAAQLPIKHDTAVGPLMTTTWNQDSPYNDLCPTYSDNNGNTLRCVTGCVATAFAQVMNYHQWPDVGTGSHSYECEVNGSTVTELSADFSQSHYRWDLMLDNYDDSSSVESCAAVAKLMSDVGISMDMGYGSSSGASEATAMKAMTQYFKYNEHCYLVNRDYYSVAEWDQMLVDEITAGRPIVYCGYAFSNNEISGHAFVLDGFDTDGYFHVNWGWGGNSDGYFLFTLLAPLSNMNFEFMQDGIFGMVPATQSADVEQVLYARSYLVPVTTSAPLGTQVTVQTEDFVIQGNMYSGYDEYYGDKRYYIDLPMSLGLFDSNGVERQRTTYNESSYLDNFLSTSGRNINLNLPSMLEDGTYQIKLFYSLDEGEHYDQPVKNYDGRDAYIKVIVSDGKAYLYDCFLSNRYTLDSFDITSGTTINQPITVDAKLSYRTWWQSKEGPVGNVYLALLKEGTQEEVSTSELCEVQLSSNSSNTYRMQLMAPDQMGLYELAIKDEDGNVLSKTVDTWSAEPEYATEPIFILPVCQQLVEDFESMTANSSTSDNDVQGNFTTWSFKKCGVRAPGEERCHGTNSVMMKKPSILSTTTPLSHNFFMAQAAFFNPAATPSKYSLEYSLDDGSTWHRANTIYGQDVEEVPAKGKKIVRWTLNLKSSQPATFRIVMTGGSTASTYVDDIALFYNDMMCDVNNDGVINIADINVLINYILTDAGVNAADVNNDGVLNIADVNVVIGHILNPGL